DDESVSVAIRDEADVVRIWLGCRGETVTLSFLTNQRLRSIADWEVAVIELFCGDNTQYVGLVLVLIQGTAHIAVLVQGSVVAGGHGIKAEHHALAQERCELNLFIAAQAWVRGFTAGIGIHEVSDHCFLEFFGKVPDVKWDA